MKPLSGFQVSSLDNSASYLLPLERKEKECKLREVGGEVVSSLLDILGMKCVGRAFGGVMWREHH